MEEMNKEEAAAAEQKPTTDRGHTKSFVPFHCQIFVVFFFTSTPTLRCVFLANFRCSALVFEIRHRHLKINTMISC